MPLKVRSQFTNTRQNFPVMTESEKFKTHLANPGGCSVSISTQISEIPTMEIQHKHKWLQMLAANSHMLWQWHTQPQYQILNKKTGQGTMRNAIMSLSPDSTIPINCVVSIPTHNFHMPTKETGYSNADRRRQMPIHKLPLAVASTHSLTIRTYLNKELASK